MVVLKVELYLNITMYLRLTNDLWWEQIMNDQVLFYQNKLAYETDSADLYEALHNKEKVKVIDARSQQAYTQEHIPGAVNLWHRDMTEENTKNLDKSYLYVTYCDGIGCNASTKGALKMSQLGFRVKELLGGLDWWKRDGYATAGENQTAGKAVVCGC